MMREQNKFAPSFDPARRWRIGHWVFFTLIDGLIIGHRQLEYALGAQDTQRIREALRACTELYWASAAAFHFAGDMPEIDYEQVVRPSMMPPHVPEGFSGTLSADHALLVQILKRLRPSLTELPDELQRDHRLYLIALDTAYESHAYVCEQFVGMGGSLKTGEIPAPQSIRNLKVRTLSLTGCPITQKRNDRR